MTKNCLPFEIKVRTNEEIDDCILDLMISVTCDIFSKVRCEREGLGFH